MNTSLTADAAEIAAVLSLQETPVANTGTESQEYAISSTSLWLCPRYGTKTQA
ncbi:hypothetical protein [Kitasatospora sp. CB02891]|uniref:hypothetical protein n=1 Tax=Kitasatospora sp. CB02891 TaxID=2020329 RepID=UPI0012FDDF29|nr:hypothetical protein [Kitasatospora sp. CB02891]